MKFQRLSISVICGLDLVMCLRVGSRFSVSKYFVIRFPFEVVVLLVCYALSLVYWRATFRDNIVVSL